MTNLEGVTTKICNVCFLGKPLEEFYNLKTGKYGKYPKCRKCQKAYFKKYYDKLKQTEAYKKAHLKRTSERHKRFPEKHRARLLARKKVPLKPACEECNGKGTLHRHHPDYSKPLEVITLCEQCHLTAHHGVMK